MARKPKPDIAWPADRTERRPIADLVPYAKNSRTHSKEQVAQIAASIEMWGWTIPVLIDPDGGIIAGHGRVLAAEKLAIEEIPCMVAEGWSDEQKRAYVIADNKLAENADWDRDFLKIEMGDLQELGFDLGLVGFDEGELKNVFLDFEVGATDASKEWQGMPEYEALDPCFRKITVNFDTQEDVDAFAKLVGQVFTDKTKSIWFPAKENRDCPSSKFLEPKAA